MLTEVYFLTEKLLNIEGRDVLAYRGQTLEIEKEDAVMLEMEGTVTITDLNPSYESPKRKVKDKKKKAKKRDTKVKKKRSTHNRTRKSSKAKKLSKT